MVHNSVFLVAHFHNVIIGGVIFGALAGYNYWFPKAFGFTLDERWGKASFWCWIIGFYLAFMPLYVLGLMGMTRRLQNIADPNWRPLLWVAELGAIVIFLGIVCQAVQLYVSIRTRESRRDLTGDPWGTGRTLEWATSSPPPAYNFAVLPRVKTIDAFWEMKRTGKTAVEPTYEAIEVPNNSPTAFVIAFFAVVTGFSLIWQIWWIVILGLLAILVTVMVFGWSENREREIPADEMARIERARLGLGGRHDDRYDRRGSPRAGARAGRRRTGLDADRRRLRVLDLHPQRFHHVLGAVRRLRGAVGPDRRRTDRTRGDQSLPRLHRDHVPLGFELRLRARGIVGRTAAAGALSGLCRHHFRARRGFSFHRDLGFCRHGKDGRRAIAQRLFIGLLHSWWACTART